MVHGRSRIRELRSITTLGTVNHERDTDPWWRPFEATLQGYQAAAEAVDRCTGTVNRKRIRSIGRRSRKPIDIYR